MVFFDYIWFRIAKLYIRRDSDGITASAVLAISQGVFVGDIIHIILKSTGSSKAFYESSFSKIEIGITLLLLVINYFNYRKKYWTLRERWKDDDKSFLKGILVILILATPLVLAYLLITK
jgi:hypothetical protein